MVDLPFHLESVRFEKLSADNFEETVSCLKRVFPDMEPMTKKEGVTPEEFDPFARMFCEVALSEGCSLVGLEENTGKVVAFTIVNDYTTPVPDAFEHVSPKFRPIVEVFKGLDDRYQAEHEYKRGEILYLFMGGVDHKFLRKHKKEMKVEGNAISRTMFELSEALIREAGFSKILGHATSFFSQNILQELGYEEKYRLDYNTYEFEGRKPFAKMPFHTHCRLVVKEL